MKKRTLLPFLLAPILFGCATATSNYTPPTHLEKITNSATLNEPFDVVWDRLVKQLSSDFFVINNIDKSSRLINVSFATQQPSKYVNCGQSRKTFSNAQGERVYNYNTADSAEYTEAMPPNSNVFYNVRRTTKLDGRANIYIAPNGKNTDVSVNAKYALSVTLNAQPFGSPYPSTSTNVADFSTKESYQSQTQPYVICATNGVIEQSVLNLAKKP